MSLAGLGQNLIAEKLFSAINAGNTDTLKESVALILVVTFIGGVARYYSSYMGQYLSDLVAVSIRRQMQRKFLRLNLSFHSRFEAGSGGLMSRILNDVNQVQAGLHQFAALFREPVLFVLLLGRLFYMDWRLTLILMISVPLIAKFSRQIAKSLQKYNHLAQNEIEKLTGNIKETLDGVRVIQSFNLENEMETRFDRIANAYLHSRKTIQKRSEIASPITEYIATLMFAGLFLYFGSKLSGLDNFAQFMAYILAMLAMSKPVTKIQDSYVKLQAAIVSGQRIYSILDSLSEVEDDKGAKEFPANWQTIEYRNVSFRYEEKDVLKNFNLTVRRGQVIALVGESGSGKSTVVNLLERFYEPYEGQILVDGVPISKISLRSLRANVALVTQDVFLFNDTARYNIQTGDVTKENKAIEPSARAAFIDTVIAKKPHGYDFRVGDRGASLSGGEKQRLSIARAFYKNAPILILDEATSALDSASEVEVQKGLESLMAGRTVFVIAHRLSTVVNADKILVLKDGRLIEEGSHDTLLEKRGEYFKFKNLQST